MRILYVHAPGDPGSRGGIQTYAADLMAGMARRGHELEVLSCEPDEMLSGGGDLLPRPGYFHPQFFWRRAYYQDYRYHQAVQRRVEAAVKRFSPQVLHVFHVYQLGALQASDRPPAVVTCHGLELEDGELVRRSLRRADAVHCNSDFTRALVEKIVGTRIRCRVLRWGVQERPGHAGSGRDYDLITVSRLMRRKNLETVLRALATRPHLRYAVVGEGPERGRLEDLARELGLTGVRFLGEVDEPRKWDLLRRSRAFVLAPRRDLGNDVEGLGLVYYEAHGAGLPCLGARSGGVPEAVGEGGLLVEDPLDVEEVGRALDALLDPDQEGSWREAVRRRRREEPWEGFLGAFEAFYGELAGGTTG